MAKQNQVKIGIGFDVDKTGLNEIQNELSRISAQAEINAQSNQLNTSLQKAGQTARQLSDILDECFSKDLGTVNLAKFNSALSKVKINLGTIKGDLAGAGESGELAFNKLGSAILGTNIKLKESNKLINSLVESMANTVTWGITSNIFNTVTGAISKAVNYSERLNTSLTDIRIVTGASAEQMEKFAESANQAAKELGASTLSYTDAALIYYQQGLNERDVQARAEATVKAANVTGQAGATVSEQLTAVWNGFRVTAEEAELYVDKLAAVAAKTGADLEELSVGMGKVASAANAMGVDIDQLNAQLATVITVTRQAPESVGTAFKTIYARLGDLDIDGVTEDGVKLGEVAEQLAQAGIKILDEKKELRDVGTIIEEVAAKWNTWNSAQRQAVAIAMAGTRQYNNLLALFENWDMYTAALETSSDALGTLQKQQDIYMQSTEAKLETLEATWQDLYEDIINEKEIHIFIEGLTNIINTYDKMINNFGGGIPGLLAFGSTFMTLFDKQIGKSIIQAKNNLDIFKHNIEIIQTKMAAISTGPLGDDLSNPEYKKYQMELTYAKEIEKIKMGITNEEYTHLLNLQKTAGELEKQITIQKRLRAEKAESAGLAHIEFDSNEELLTQEQDNIDTIEKNKALLVELKQLQEKVNNINAKDSSIIGGGVLIAKKDKDFSDFSEDTKTIFGKELDALNQQVITKEKILEIQSKIKEKIVDTEKQNEKQTLELQKQNKAIKEIYSINEKISNLDDSQQAVKIDFDDLVKQGKEAAEIQKWTTRITSGVSLLTSTWNNLNSTIKIFGDESLTAGQKAGQLLTTLTTSLPVGINAFMKLNETMGYNGSIISNLLVFKEKDNALTALGNVLGEDAIKGLTKKQKNQLIELAATEQLNTTKLKEIGLDQTSALVKKVSSTSTEELAAATLSAKVAQDAYNTSLWKSPLFIIGAVVLGVGAAIAATVAIVDAFTVSMEEANAALKKSAESYSKIEIELQSLDKEIETTGDRLRDLQAIAAKDLTIVEQEEINNLKAENIQLQAKLKTLQQIEAIERKQVIDDTKQFIKTQQEYDNAINNTNDFGDPFRKRKLAVKGFSIDNIKHPEILDLYNRYVRVDKTDYKNISNLYQDLALQEKAYLEKLNDLNLSAEDREILDKELKNIEIIQAELPLVFGSYSDIVTAYGEQIEKLKTSINAARIAGDTDTAQNIEALIFDYYKNTGSWGTVVQEAFNSAVQNSGITKEQWNQARALIDSESREAALGENFVKKIETLAFNLKVPFDALWSSIFDTAIVDDAIENATEKTKYIDEELKKKQKAEWDRAYISTQRLKQLENAYNSLIKTKEYLSKSNDKYLDILKEEGELLQEQNKEIEEQIHLREIDRLNTVIELKNTYGFTFNGNEITNVNKILTSLMGTEQYEEAKKAVEKYYTLIRDTLPGLEQQRIDNLYTQIQQNVEQVNLKIELGLETSQAEREWREFYNSIMSDIDEDDIIGNINLSSSNLSSYQGDLSTAINNIPKIIAEIEKGRAGYSSLFSILDDKTGQYVFNEELAKSELQKYIDLGKTSIQAIANIKETIEEAYLQALEQADEKIEKQLQIYERINETAEKNIQIIELLQGENNFTALDKQYQKQIDNNLKYLNMLQQELNYWDKQRTEGDESVREEAEEKWLETNQKLQEVTLNSIEVIKKSYTNALQKVIDDFNKTLLDNGITLDLVEKEWSLISDDADRYLDSVNAAYEIDKLQAKYLEAIDSSDELSVQTSLNNLMKDELDLLRSKGRLTEYDIKRAEARYQIALKQQQLEDQKNNPTQLKLRRDASGNYSYTFVADEDEISKTKQELADLNNQLYNIDKDAYKNSLKEVYDIYIEYQQEMMNAMSIEDDVKRKAAIDKLEAEYEKRITDILAHYNGVRESLAYDGLTAIEDIYKNSEIYNFIANIADKGFVGVRLNFDDALEEYKQNLTDIEAETGFKFSGIVSGATELTKEIQTLNTKADNSNLITSLTTLDTTLTTTIKPLLELLSTTLSDNTLNTLADALKVVNNSSSLKGVFSTNIQQGLLNIDPSIRLQQEQADAIKKFMSDYWGSEFNETADADNLLSDLMVAIMNTYGGAQERTESNFLKILRKIFPSFDTGGYTGSWGSEGRLAMIHEKELILNKTDTPNILSAVSIVRDIGGLLNSLMGGLYNRVAINTPSVSTFSNDVIKEAKTVDQKVQIEAHFHDATTAQEIETAFTNLINVASQRAYENKK